METRKVFDHKFTVVGVKCPLDAVFELGEPYCRLTPTPGNQIFKAALEVNGFPVLSSTSADEYKLNATFYFNQAPVHAAVKRIVSLHVEWEIAVRFYRPVSFYSKYTLVMQYVLIRENMPPIHQQAIYACQ